MAARTPLCAGITLLCLVASAGSRPPSQPGRILYGVTVDRITHLSQLRSALGALPERPTLRIVFDRSEPPGYYAAATQRLAGVSWVMGELLDSSQERTIGVAALARRARAYLRRLGSHISIWEVGNELNGNWTGPYPQVAAKTSAVFSALSAAHVSTALTLYANDFGPGHCGDGPGELSPVQFARRYLPARLREHLDYLLLSYYPTQCRGVEPSGGVVATHLRQLHRLFPHARLGFGEMGLARPVSPRTAGRARQIMRWAYSLKPGLPQYAGGYFWWYAAEDALHPGAPLRAALDSAFNAERAALSGG